MSQSGIINIAGGGGGGSPILTVTGDTGGAVTPTLNNINLVGGTSTANNALGITVAGTLGTSTETVTLTNRQTGSVTTADATPTTLISFTASAAAAVYHIECRVAAFDATDVAGASYIIEGGVRTTGAATTLITPTDITLQEEAAMGTADIDLTVSGNTFNIVVTGIAAKSIRWFGVMTYVQVV